MQRGTRAEQDRMLDVVEAAELLDDTRFGSTRQGNQLPFTRPISLRI